MFFAGGTFGAASEAHDANKRPSGRRHQARDMAELQAAVDARKGLPPAPAEEARHAATQKKMAAGPSFLDRMHQQNSAVVDMAHPTRRRGSAPADHLNIFSWHDTAPASRTPHQDGQLAESGSRATQPVKTTAPAPTAEDRRAQEARKFETNTESAFLRFINAPKAQLGAEVGNRGTRTGAVSRKIATSLPPCSDIAGNPMRDQPEKPRGRRGKAAAATDNRSGAPEESGIAGFPGMGQRGILPGTSHVSRKPEQSNPFPSPTSTSMQQKDVSQGENVRAPEAPEPMPKDKCSSPYYIDADDYESRYPANTYEAEAYGQQEIRMYDDNEYDDYEQAHTGDTNAGAPRRPQAMPSPEWLHDSPVDGGASGLLARSPSEQRHRYRFDAEKQQVYEADGLH